MTDRRVIEELKPCPFCGEAGRIVERHNPMSKWRFSVDCTSGICGCSGPVEATRPNAIEAWNIRYRLTLHELVDKAAQALYEETHLGMAESHDYALIVLTNTRS